MNEPNFNIPISLTLFKETIPFHEKSSFNIGQIKSAAVGLAIDRLDVK